MLSTNPIINMFFEKRSHIHYSVSEIKMDPKHRSLGSKVLSDREERISNEEKCLGSKVVSERERVICERACKRRRTICLLRDDLSSDLCGKMFSTPLLFYQLREKFSDNEKPKNEWNNEVNDVVGEKEKLTSGFPTHDRMKVSSWRLNHKRKMMAAAEHLDSYWASGNCTNFEPKPDNQEYCRKCGWHRDKPNHFVVLLKFLFFALQFLKFAFLPFCFCLPFSPILGLFGSESILFLEFSLPFSIFLGLIFGVNIFFWFCRFLFGYCVFFSFSAMPPHLLFALHNRLFDIPFFSFSAWYRIGSACNQEKKIHWAIGKLPE